MNYRHAFHAGNFADVVKHVLLVALVERLAEKPKPMAVIDTHAGIGVYDLTGEAPRRTGEWRDGIGRLWRAAPSHPGAVARYLELVRALNAPDAAEPGTYPGSPELVRLLLRASDRLVLNELHPEDCASLRRAMGGDRRVHVHCRDGYELAAALVPPSERRGLVLIDPPFEQRDEYARLVEALAEAHRRFATGTYMIWYPLKDPAVSGEFLERLAADGPPKTLALELQVTATDPMRMTGSGMILVNPPFVLTETGTDGKSAALSLLDWLAAALAQGPGARAREEWLTA